jgi:hypothetical protein
MWHLLYLHTARLLVQRPAAGDAYGGRRRMLLSFLPEGYY